MRILLNASRLVFALLLLSIAAFAPAKPDRKDPPPAPKAAPIPQLAGPSNWGWVEQDGRKLTIRGHARWEATGEIRKDGKVVLSWIESDGRTGQGLYVVDGVNLRGTWNYSTEITIDADGTMHGLTLPDIVERIMPPAPGA